MIFQPSTDTLNQSSLTLLKLVKATFLFSLITVFFACNTDKLEKKIAELEAEKLEANGNLNGKEAIIVDYMASMNEIQANLATIKETENIITTRFSKGNVEMSGSMKDDILGDIDLINNLLIENKEKISALKSRYNKSKEESNLKIKEIEAMLGYLTLQIEEKDGEIAELHKKLADANKQLTVLFNEYNNRLEELGDQEDELNTAYYCYGSKKELKEQGVISKKGGFIGIGKTAKLSKDFNTEYFTKIDVSIIREIDLMVDKVKLISNHPSESYEIVGESGARKLKILDSKVFWSISKYLVIQVD